MTEQSGEKSTLPEASGNISNPASNAPPHPLDGSWHLNIEGKNYGPYTGHELLGFAKEGRITGNTQIVPVGGTTWSAAKDDPILRGFFEVAKVAAPPARGNSDSRVSASEGATIVQVTNNLGPQPGYGVAGVLLDGAAANKSAGLALVLSLLICGLGQFYNGQIGKGILMFVLMIALWFVLLGWIIWIWSAVDAYKTAKAMNLRYHMLLAGAAPISARG
ncbi:GYF domain-containing protein [Mesorhizobium sp. MSK_1335]|uniref:GYF domain-containing protein n=1 Tax=Mesorhizobium montanum TaxID=3072323 RepID=A0ABU4ZI87_9HYPH|nr:GYF domain-containing protein [Mesorhizobium sp. MSK_1335]MDX8524767.1 GYF domain-containing protein [Mesorhizobium sp. MSK_1335]